MQPRARLADLVRAFGAGAGLVDLGSSTSNGSSSGNDDGMLSSLVASQRAREHELLRARLRERAAAVNAARAAASANASACASAGTLLQPPERTLTVNWKSRSQVSLPSYESRPASPSPRPAPAPGYTPVAGPSTSTSSRSKAVEAGYPEDDTENEKDALNDMYSLSSSLPSTSQQSRRRVPHTALRVSFSPRRIGLLYVPPSPSGSQHQSVADLPRTGDEPLERAASRLVAALKMWLDARHDWSL